MDIVVTPREIDDPLMFRPAYDHGAGRSASEDRPPVVAVIARTAALVL